nr:hypothetical protein [Tanacetum cinerariifolium]
MLMVMLRYWNYTLDKFVEASMIIYFYQVVSAQNRCRPLGYTGHGMYESPVELYLPEILVVFKMVFSNGFFLILTVLQG